jgi:DNA polymerase III gamma/tau subunit
MVVGPTGGGKSSSIRVLANALTTLNSTGQKGERFEKTKIYHLNPKSVRMGQLYGEFDANTVIDLICYIDRQYSTIYFLVLSYFHAFLISLSSS